MSGQMAFVHHIHNSLGKCGAGAFDCPVQLVSHEHLGVNHHEIVRRVTPQVTQYHFIAQVADSVHAWILEALVRGMTSHHAPHKDAFTSTSPAVQTAGCGQNDSVRH